MAVAKVNNSTGLQATPSPSTQRSGPLSRKNALTRCQRQPIVLNTSTSRPITAAVPMPTGAPSFLQTHVTSLPNNIVRLATGPGAAGQHEPSKLRLKPGQKLDWLFKAKTSCMAAQKEMQKKVYDITTKQNSIATIDDLVSIHNDFQIFITKMSAKISQIGSLMKLDFISGLQTVTLINRTRPSANAVRKKVVRGGTAAAAGTTTPMGGLKIRPTSELLAKSAPRVVETKPVEIDDDDDCTVVEDTQNPLESDGGSAMEPEVNIMEPEVCIMEPEVCIMEPEVCITEPEVCITEPEVCITEPEVCITEPEVCITEPDVCITEPEVCITEPEAGATKAADKETSSASPGKGGGANEAPVSLLDTSEKVSALDRSGEGVAKGEDGTTGSDKGAEPDDEAADALDTAIEDDANSSAEDNGSDEEDPETRVMIQRAMKESALENITLENRNVRHVLSDKDFEHYLGARVYMESHYGTGLPIRTDLPTRIKEEPAMDVEEMLTGTMVSRTVDKTSFGDAFSQFLNTSNADDGADEADDGENGRESGGRSGGGDDGDAQREESAEGSGDDEAHGGESAERSGDDEAQGGEAEERNARPEEAEAAAPADDSARDARAQIDAPVAQNRVCAVKDSCENSGGLDLDRNDLKSLMSDTKHLSDVPLDELLFDVRKSPGAIDFVGFDEKLLN